VIAKFNSIFKHFMVICWSIHQIFLAAPREVLILSFLLVIQGVMPGLGLLLIQRVIDVIIGPSSLYQLPFFLMTLWGGGSSYRDPGRAHYCFDSLKVKRENLVSF